jgi:ketosteroid isomerase-like protein
MPAESIGWAEPVWVLPNEPQLEGENMSDTAWVQNFTDALHRLETQGDIDAMVSQFAPDATLWTPVQPEPHRGSEEIRQFWQRYREQFERIVSTFERDLTADGQSALEWQAEGVLATGNKDITYRGVTLLRGGEKGITRFVSYYDMTPFLSAINEAERRNRANNE